MPRIRSLVTGGLGFLGSHLVDVLLAQGDEVTIVDNLSSNAVVAADYSQKCRVVCSSVEDFRIDQQFDCVYHLASVVGPAGVLPYAGKMGLSILVETCKLIDFCIEQGARFILVSTSEVYGRDGIFGEDVDKIVAGRPSVRTEYGVGKLLAEIATINRARVAPFRYYIIRPFNISGPRQRPDGGFVLPRFVLQAQRGEDITVFAGGRQLRAFTHALDIVEAMILAAHSDLPNGVWNVGNIRNLTSIGELAQMVKEACGSSSRVVYLDGKEIYGPLYEEAFDKLPNVSRIERELGWRPKYSLADIVQDVIRYYAAHAAVGA